MDFIASGASKDLPNHLRSSLLHVDLHLLAVEMSISHLLILLIATVLVIRRIRLRYWKGISQYPGPVLASFTNAWRLWDAYYNAHSPLSVIALHEKHGDIVRLGPKMLSFSSPDSVRDIYGPGKNYVKSEYYSSFAVINKGVRRDNIFSTRDQQWHSEYRRAINPAFTLSAILKNEKFVDETAELLFEKINQRIEERGTKHSIDLPRLLQFFAFDAVGMLAYSKKHGFLEMDTDIDGIIGTTRGVADHLSRLANVPFLEMLINKNPIALWLSRLGIVEVTVPLVSFAKNHQPFARISAQLSSPNKETPRRDLLDLFVEAHKAKPEVITEQEIIDLGVLQGAAGSEPVHVALSVLIFQLLKHPVTLSKLQSEIDTHLPASASFASWTTTSTTMPYLDACIKECFRLHPPAGFIMERVTPASGAVVCGRHIPGGVVIGCSPWAVHRHKETFGEDVEVFRPERWIEADEEKRRLMEKTLCHFGSGPHHCIGKGMSLIEVYKVAAEILRRYDMKLSKPDKGMKMTVGAFVRIDYDVQMKRRTTGVSAVEV